MQIIVHRRNTIAELKATPAKYGIEMDIRSYGGRLIVHHEPFVNAVDFEEWIKFYKHKTLILNIKEEGIEYRVKEIVEKYGIQDYFFLDLSFPYLIKMINSGEKRVAIRFSEYESLETVLTLTGKAEWVWIDCFTRCPLHMENYRILSNNFKLCLVSPELVGRGVEIRKIQKTISCMKLDAVCTKQPHAWYGSQSV